MAESDVRFFSVVEVDKGMSSPLQHTPKHKHAENKRNRLIHNILFALVCIALCGLTVQGFFIYNLYMRNFEPHPHLRLNKAQLDVPDETLTSELMNPSKPLAHLTASSKVPDKNGLMQWDNTTDVIHQLKYREGKLVVEKGGFYYVYSKICFNADNNFIHSVQKETQRYQNKPIELLNDRRYQTNSPGKGIKSSYLGGVFYFYKNDAVFVSVTSSSLVCQQSNADNFFGMFKL